MDQREGENHQREANQIQGDQDDLQLYGKVKYQSFPSYSTMPGNNKHVLPESLHLPENCLPSLPPNHSFQLPQHQITPYHPIRKSAFPGNPSFCSTYDATLDADFSRLNLSASSRSSYGLGVHRSLLRNMSDSSHNVGIPPISSSQLDYTDLNLQRIRVESAVRGQTGVYLETLAHGFPGLGKEILEGFGLNGLNPSSRMYNQYNNVQNNNGGGYGIDGFNNWSRLNQRDYDVGYGAPTNLNNRNCFPSAHDIAYGPPANACNQSGYHSFYDMGYGATANLNRNGFQSVHKMDYGAPGNSNKNGFPDDNGSRQRGRSGSGSDNSGRSRSSSNSNNNISPLSDRLNKMSFEQYRGHMVYLAKDQHGYAYLKKKIEEGKKEEIEMVFLEVKDHVRELMVDQYGNYSIQKFFEVCNHDQMTQMLLTVVSDANCFIDICVDNHGSRAVQKMLEHLSTAEQVTIVMSVISRNTLVLAKSMSGYRVIERCLQSFTNEDCRDILHVVADNCADIAMDQAGCCVLQQCVLHADGQRRQRLINGIIENTLVLSENIYGNYVVQYILGMKVHHFTESVMEQLSGSYVYLSMNKYGSNVVERCMRDSNQEQSTRIISEIINSPNFLMVLQDPFGNYVTQTALEIAKGTLRHTILSLIQCHYPYLHSHPHGKRVLAKTRGSIKHHRGYEFRK